MFNRNSALIQLLTQHRASSAQIRANDASYGRYDFVFVRLGRLVCKLTKSLRLLQYEAQLQ